MKRPGPEERRARPRPALPSIQRPGPEERRARPRPALPAIQRWLVLAAIGCGAPDAAPRGPAVRAAFDPVEATIPELQTALRDGAVTSRELVAMYLARIDAYDERGPALNAISVVNPHALDEAAALDEERRTRGPRGPLHGVPVIVKDNYETAGLQTAAGSRALAGWVPDTDATLVERLRAAGAIIVAKANMDELGLGFVGAGSLFGQIHNPYAPARTPGGSSGGVAASVAASFAAAGLGTDTCGSVRVPSAHNSLVGLRGTQGLASRRGIVPLSHTMDIPGPLARSVTDVAILMDLVAGYDPADPQTANGAGHIPRTYTEALRADGLRGARIGLVTDLLGSDPENVEVTAVIRRALAEMQAAGAAVVEVSIAGLDALRLDRMRGFLVAVHELKPGLAEYFAHRPSAPVHSLDELVAKSDAPPMVAEWYALATSIDVFDTKEYVDHVLKRDRLREAILTTMAEHRLDALAYPTFRRKAGTIGEPQPRSTNCTVASGSGLPAIAMPAGFSGDGVPIGIELLGRTWSEATLLRLAYAFEQATHHRRPPPTTPRLAEAR